MMMHILYSIKKFGNLFDTKAERLMFRHPLLGFFAMFVGVPAFVLLAVGISSNHYVSGFVDVWLDVSLLF